MPLWRIVARTRRARQAGPFVECGAIELRGNENAVAMSNDLAARDLGLATTRSSFSSDPPCDELSTHALLRRLEETERAEDSVSCLDEEIALEPGQLLELRDEGFADLAGQLGRAILSTPS